MVTCSWAHSGDSKQKEIDLKTQPDTTAEYYSLQSEYYHCKYYGDNNIESALKSEVDLLQSTFRNLDVIEIACGTGFWTEAVAETAKSICATDVNSSMINAARRRLSHLNNVSFDVFDAFDIFRAPRKYDGAFCVLFWCHIPVQRINGFLSSVCAAVEPGSPVAFIDQLEDSDRGDHATDSFGNRIAQRRAGDKLFPVVKNIPSAVQLNSYLNKYAESGSIRYSSDPDSSGMWTVLWNTAGR